MALSPLHLAQMAEITGPVVPVDGDDFNNGVGLTAVPTGVTNPKQQQIPRKPHQVGTQYVCSTVHIVCFFAEFNFIWLR